MNRRSFLKKSGLIGAILLSNPKAIATELAEYSKLATQTATSIKTGNILLTPQIIAKEALTILQEKFMFENFSNDYSQKIYTMSDKITIRKPVKFTVKK